MWGECAYTCVQKNVSIHLRLVLGVGVGTGVGLGVGCLVGFADGEGFGELLWEGAGDGEGDGLEVGGFAALGVTVNPLTSIWHGLAPASLRHDSTIPTTSNLSFSLAPWLLVAISRLYTVLPVATIPLPKAVSGLHMSCIGFLPP